MQEFGQNLAPTAAENTMTVLRTNAAAAAIIVACIDIGGMTRASADETGAVLAANARFYAALNTMFSGEVAPIEAVWSHADDVTYMGPTGNYEQGWSAVRKDWRGQAAMKLVDGI